MIEKRIKIAVISDLHCHPNRIDEKNITYLLTDKLRSSTYNHPVESLLKIINDEEEGLNVDITLCPGDFTDKSDIQGFISGWGFSLEISQELKSHEIIATLGNHDVDVYETTSNYSLTNAKGIKRDFPFKDEKLRDIFWSRGCAFIEGDTYRVLVINSSHFHYNKDASHEGKISDDALEYIEEYLKKNIDDKIQIAMSHHPPISHSNKDLGEDDKIVNGDSLLDLLGLYKFDLFIYGHKHHPFIKYYNTSNGNNVITLFSSGSFSSGANLMFASIRNYFHVIEISKNSNISRGKVKTWTFFPTEGWTLNFDQNGFAPYSGFGCTRKVDQILEEIKELIKGRHKMSWDEVLQKVNDIDNLIPEDSKKLYDLLKDNGLVTDEHLWNNPKNLFNTNNGN